MKVNVNRLIVVLILLGVFASCVNSKKEENTNDKKELVLAIGGEPGEGFDPIMGWGQYGSPLFHSTLLYYDEAFNIKKDLATSYEVSEDGLTWTVEIRKDVKFTDGEPLTADDVVFTFNQIKTNASSIDLTNVEEVTKLDDYTVRFQLKERDSTFIFFLITIGIVPEHAYDDGYAENPIGSGPFEMVQWDKGQQLIVKINPDFYEEIPYFEKLTFLFLSEDAAFAAAKTGSVDVVAIPPSFANNAIKGLRLEEVPSVDNRGISLQYVPNEGKTNAEGAPIGNNVTADIAIRKALNIVVDRQALVDGVLNGYGTPAYTAVDHMPWWNPETTIEDGDLEKAKTLLEEADWKEGKDGIREKNGQKAELTLYYPSNDQTRQSLAIAFADMVKPLGVSVKPVGRSWNELSKEMYSNPVLFGYGNHSPRELYNAFSSNTKGQGLRNTNYYGDERTDAYFEKALAAPTQEEANEYWKKSQWDGEFGYSFRGAATWVWLVNLDHLYLVRENLEIGEQKIQPHGHGWPITDNIQHWTWKE